MGKQRQYTIEEIAQLNNNKVVPSGNPFLSNVGDSKYNKDMLADDSVNVEDFRNSRQSGLESFTNMIGRNVARLALRTADSVAFIPAAIGNVLYDTLAPDEQVEFSDVYDNPVSKYLRELEQKADEAMPMYRSAKAQGDDAGAFVADNLTSLGGLDKLLNGLTYVASMGAAKKIGTGLVKGIGKYGSRLISAIDKGEDVSNPSVIASLFDDTAKPMLDKLTQSQAFSPNTKSALENGAYAMWGSMVESAAEASETKKSIIEALTKQKMAANGGQPLTPEELRQIKETSETGGMLNFVANVAMTTGTNNLIFNKLFDNKWVNEVKAIKGIDFAGDVAQREVVEKATKGYMKYVNKGKAALTSEVGQDALWEGAQEGGQSLSNNLIVNILTAPEMQKEQDVLDKLTAAAKIGGSTFLKTIGSKDGIESMLLGSMIGGGAGYLINKQKDKVTENAEVDATINAINGTSGSLTSLYNAQMKGEEIQEAANGALLNNDRFNYENFKTAGLFTAVNGYDKADKMDKFYERLNQDRELAKTDLEAYRQKYKIRDTGLTTEEALKKINQVETTAKQIISTKNKILDNYGIKLQGPQGEKILEALTLYDTFKHDLSKRESNVIAELKDEGLDYMDYISKSDDRKVQLQQREKELGGLMQQAKDSKDIDALRKYNDEYASINNELLEELVPSNYLKQFEKMLNGIEEKDKVKGQQLRTNANLGKIRDLQKIQTYKHDVMSQYASLVEGDAGREAFLKQITEAEAGDRFISDFTTSVTDPNTGVQEDMLVRKGSVVKLRRTTERNYAKKDKDGNDLPKKREDKDEYAEIADTYYKTDENGNRKAWVKVRNADGSYSNIPMEYFKKSVPDDKKNTKGYKDFSYPRIVKFSKAFEDAQTEKTPEFEALIKAEREKVENKDLTDEDVEKKAYGIAKKTGVDITRYINNRSSISYQLPEWKLYQSAKNKLVRYTTESGREIVGFLSYYNGEQLSIRSYNEVEGKFKTSKVNLNNANSAISILSENETIAVVLKNTMKDRVKQLEAFKKSYEKKKDTAEAKTNKGTYYKRDRLQTILDTLTKNLNTETDEKKSAFILSRLNKVQRELHELESEIKLYDKVTDGTSPVDADMVSKIKAKMDEVGYSDEIESNKDAYYKFKQALKAQNQQILDEYNDFMSNMIKELEQSIMSEPIDQNGNVDSYFDEETGIFNREALTNFVGEEGSDLDKLGRFMREVQFSKEPLVSFLSVLRENPNFDYDQRLTNEINNHYTTLQEAKDKIHDATYERIANELGLTKENVDYIINNQIALFEEFYNSINNRYYDYMYLDGQGNTQGYEQNGTKKVSKEILFRTTGDSQKTSNFFEERFYRNITSINPATHKVVPITKDERSSFGYGTQEGYFLKVIDSNGKVVGTTTLRNPKLKKGDVIQTTASEKNLFLRIKSLFENNGYAAYVTDTGLNPVTMDAVKRAYTVLTTKTDNDEELAFLENFFKNHVVPIVQLREIIDQHDGEIPMMELDITAVQWGYPVKTEEQTSLKAFLSDDSYNKLINEDRKTQRIAIPFGKEETITTKLGSFNISSGFTYYVNEETGTVLPVKTKKVSAQQARTLIYGLKYIQKEVDKGRDYATVIAELSKRNDNKDPDSKNGLLRRYFNFVSDNAQTKLMYNYDANTKKLSLIYGIDENGVNREIFLDDIKGDIAEYDAALYNAVQHITNNVNHNVDNKEFGTGIFEDVDIDMDGELHKRSSNKTYTQYLVETQLYSNVKTAYGNKFDNGYVVVNNSFPTVNLEAGKRSSPKVKISDPVNKKKADEDKKDEEKEVKRANRKATKPTPKRKSRGVDKQEETTEVVEDNEKAEEAAKPATTESTTVVKDEETSDGTPSASRLEGMLRRKKGKSRGGLSAEDTTTEPTPPAPSNEPDNAGEDDEIFMLANNEFDEEVMSDADFESARKLFIEKYNIPFNIANGLIKNKAWGMLTKAGAVVLSDQAISGTQYHEEFHVVSQLALTPKQRQLVYDDWRKNNKSRNEFTDKQVEEELADEYRFYRMSGSVPTKSSILQRFFDYLTNLLKNLLFINSKPSMRDGLFRDIEKGKYYNSLRSGGVSNDFYMSGKLSVVKKKRLVDKIYSEYVKQMTIKRKEVDFKLSDLTNEQNHKLLTRPESYLLLKLQEQYGEIEGNKKFQQYEGFSQKNALLSLLNNPNDITDFLDMDVTTIVKVDGVRTAKQVPMLEYLIRQGLSTLTPEETADFRLDPKAVTSVLKAKIQSELGIKPTLEYEETNDKQGVEDSNAINHYEAAQGKIKLVLESLIQRGDATNPKGFKNATEYLNSIFDMVKKLKDSDAETFFRALKGSYPALWSAIGMNNLEANPNSPAVEELVAFQNAFFQFLSKQTLDYQILKVVNNDLDSDENHVTFISALEDKATDNIIDEWISKINVLGLRSLDKVDLAKVFNIGGDVIQAIRNDINFINKALEKKRIGKLRNKLKKAALIKYNSATNKVKTILSLVNAEGKSIYSIQNFSSLMKRYEEYIPNDSKAPVVLSSKSGVKNLVPFLGIQSKSTTVRETNWGDTQVKNESDAINSAKLDEFDIQSLSFHAVMKAITDKDTGGFMPFLFSGDKSSYWGIPIYIKERPKGQMTGLYREYFKGVLNNELSRYHAYKESTKQKTYVKGNAVLPFYSFLETDNEAVYKQILASNGGITDELMNTVLSLVDNRIRNQAANITSYFDGNNLNKGEYTSDTDMYDYALITTVGMMEQSQHLTGDMMYYNDFTKRIPAIASTKETLNLSDNAIKFYNKNLKVKNEKPINAKEFNTLVINDVYIKTEEMTSEGDLKDYSKNNSADAQAYISLNTAKFILFSSGRWNNDYKMLFEQIERDNLSAKDFTRIHNEINEHLNALKPQYYGFYNGTNIPIFYKMSVVPLYEGYTRGKNLDKIRTMMNENGLNMVIFESGNKVGKKVGNGTKISDVNKEGEVTLSMYDKDMNFNPSYAREISKGNYEYSPISNMGQAITDFKQVSPWKYFGVQVETNNQKNKNIFGTQMRVLGLIDLMEDPNIDKKAKAMFAKNGMSYDTTISPLQNISRYFDSLINEKYRKDKNKLMSKLGLNDDYSPLNEQSSKEKIKQTLIDQAIGSGATIEFVNQLRNLDSYDMVTNKVKLQSIVQKMLDLTKQKLFGEPKVQVASTFFEPSNSNILSTRLKAYKSDDEFYMEVYLPLEYAEQYGDLINTSFDADGILRPKAGINIDVMTMIGYRIPTQYVNALDKIRVMGFVPGVSRNQVIVPAEITTKTGSDFDVDKLNMFFPKITRTKKPTADQVREGLAPALKESLKLLKKHTEQGENVDYEKGLIESILENFDVVDELSSFGEDELSDVERNILNEVHKFIKANTTLEVNMSNVDNRIIQFYSDMLSFRKNLVISPNEQTIVKPAIREIEKAQEKVNGDGFKYNAFDIFWLNNRRNSFMTAKSTLGIQALAQKHHALCQIYDIKINDAETAYKLGDKNDTRAIKLSTLLSFFSNDFKPNAVYDFGRTRDLSGKSIISKVISETIDATVDAAKDDYIASANFRNETANVFNLLVRLGINYKVALNFIAQPGIVDMIREKRVSKSTTSDSGRVAYEAVDLKQIKFKKMLDAETLLKQITKDGRTYEFQDSVRQLFIALNQHASILSDFTKISTFDTKGIGTSIDENQLMLNNYEVNKNKIFNYFTGSKEMFEGEGHTTFLETFKNVSQQSNKFTKRFFEFERLVLDGYLPQFKKYIDEKFNDKRKTDLEKTQERQRAKDLAITFLMQQHLLKNGTDVKDLAVNLSNRIKEARNRIKDNFLLDNLVASNTSEGIASADRKEINNILLYNSAKLEREEANDYTDSWKELYDLDKGIALDLAKLVVFQSGIINSPVTIYNLIPLEIKEELGIESFDMLDFDLTISDDIITKVVKNNIENKNIFNRTLVINENWRNLGEGLQQRLEAKGVTSKMWEDLRKDYSHLDESVLLEKIMEC